MKEIAKYKQDFIHFLVEVKALQFGEFTLKSGRVSPYFFNSAMFNTGKKLAKLGYFYALALKENESEYNLIFGPAYKGIPLCVSTAIASATHFDKEVGYVFNRKERKNHGDKGILVGQIPTSEDMIIMIDDVITDGTTKKESIRQMKASFGIEFSSVWVAIDRMESNAEGKNTITEFERETSVSVKAIVNIQEVCDYLLEREIAGEIYLNSKNYREIEAYLQKYHGT